MSRLIVQKYGGSSLATPDQIRAVAKRIAKLREDGNQLIVVVSAMGNSTDDLIELAEAVSPTPNPRELDMLLSTGERVSMALLSMCLKDLGVNAISFTGSQAGILTDSSHTSARIVDIRPTRVKESLEKDFVVVLAGFQGVDPDSKEITTLGRGGSDLTAVALAAHFKADRCEILKDVDGVYTADPRVVPQARRIPSLSWDSLLEMTYWGSPVLHFRSVELAHRLRIPIAISLAHPQEVGQHQDVGGHMGTLVTAAEKIANGKYETGQVLSINSHNIVRALEVQATQLGAALSQLHAMLKEYGLSWPQILDSEKSGDNRWTFHITAPSESIKALDQFLKKTPAAKANAKLSDTQLSSVTATCFGMVASDFTMTFAQKLESNGIAPKKILTSPLSVTAIIDESLRNQATEVLHELVTIP